SPRRACRGAAGRPARRRTPPGGRHPRPERVAVHLQPGRRRPGGLPPGRGPRRRPRPPGQEAPAGGEGNAGTDGTVGPVRDQHGRPHHPGSDMKHIILSLPAFYAYLAFVVALLIAALCSRKTDPPVDTPRAPWRHETTSAGPGTTGQSFPDLQAALCAS